MQNKLIAAVFIYLCILSSVANAAVADVNKLFSTGEAAFKNENFELAAQSFAQAVKLAPQNLKTRFRYGQSLFLLKKFTESYNQFQTVLQNSPNNIIARIYLSENLIKLNRCKEAKAHLEWILKIQPGHARAAELLKEIESLNEENTGKEVIPDGFRPLPVKDSQLDLKEVRSIDAPVANRVANAKASKEEKSFLPPDAIEVDTWDIAEFFKKTADSFMINLEYGRYAIEKGDLKLAREKLLKAEQLARENQDSRQFLEVQILTSLIYVYSKDFYAFGKHLIKLKPLLSKGSYKSFLDIYNQARELKNSADLARLASGVAMGAGHYAVASNLLKEALLENPDDPLLMNMLADAQMKNLDYTGAEKTLSDIARADQKNPEAYFNLARFYLTASYNPEMARRCAQYALSLRSDDYRISVLLALIEYAEGKIDTGIARLKQLMPKVKDQGFKAICSKIINDGQYADSKDSKEKLDFAEVLALPGASHAPRSSYRLLADDYLKKGSFFTAMRFFMMAQDLAEIGRTYLGLSSALYMNKEEKTASIAAGFGLRALNDELNRNPESGRANLYLALYHFERNEFADAGRAVRKGLNGSSERTTRKKLTALLDTLNRKLKN